MYQLSQHSTKRDTKFTAGISPRNKTSDKQRFRTQSSVFAVGKDCFPLGPSNNFQVPSDTRV